MGQSDLKIDVKNVNNKKCAPKFVIVYENQKDLDDFYVGTSPLHQSAKFKDFI